MRKPRFVGLTIPSEGGASPRAGWGVTPLPPCPRYRSGIASRPAYGQRGSEGLVRKAVPVSGYPVTLDPITGRAGQTLTVSLLWREGTPLAPVPLTGWAALAQVRVSPDSPVLAELSSADGEVVLDGDLPDYNVVCHFTEAHTLAIGAGSFKFDIRLANADESRVVYLAEAALKFKTPYSRAV